MTSRWRFAAYDANGLRVCPLSFPSIAALSEEIRLHREDDNNFDEIWASPFHFVKVGEDERPLTQPWENQ